MRKCSCFVEKNRVLRRPIFTYIYSPNSELSAIVFLNVRNVPSMQHCVLLILFYGIRASRKQRAKVFARFYAFNGRMP